MKRLPAILIILLATLLCCDVASAAGKKAKKKKQTIEQVKADRNKAKKAKGEKAKEVANKKKQVKIQVNELQRIQADIAQYQANVIKLNDEIDALDLKIKAIDDSITILDEHLRSMQAKYATIVKKAYMRNRNATSDLAFIFSSKSFSQAYKRSEALKKIAKWQKSKSEELKTAKAALDKKKQELNALKDTRKSLLEDLETELNKLEAERDKCEKIISNLKKDQKLLQEEYKRRQKEEDEYNAELQRLIREEEARKIAEARKLEKARKDSIANAKRQAEKDAKKRDAERKKQKDSDKNKPQPDDNKNKVNVHDDDKKTINDSQKQGKDSKTAVTPSMAKSDFASMKGRLPYPVSGKIILHYGSNTDPVTKISRREYGITISTSPGAAVCAVCEGVVEGFIARAGCVIINHGEYRSIYRGLRSFKVKKGEKVRMGQTLGYLRVDPDDPDYSNLKFEINHNGVTCDPEQWLR